MIVFAHSKFGLVRIKGSGCKRPPPRNERVFEISAWIGLNNCKHAICKYYGKCHFLPGGRGGGAASEIFQVL